MKVDKKYRQACQERWGSCFLMATQHSFIYAIMSSFKLNCCPIIQGYRPNDLSVIFIELGDISDAYDVLFLIGHLICLSPELCLKNAMFLHGICSHSFHDTDTVWTCQRRMETS